MSAERASLDEQFIAGERASLIEGYRDLADSEGDAGLFRRLGICLYDTKQLDDARVAFKKALSLDHSDSISRRRLSLIEMRPAPKVKAAPKKKKAAAAAAATEPAA
jgi:hypothetical protein